MEHDLGQIVDALPGLVWTARPDGRVEFLNARWLEYTGISIDQAVPDGWMSAVHSEDLATFLRSWQTIRASGKPGEMEARLRRFDGIYHWFLFRMSPATDAAGEVIRWCGIN